MRRVALALLVNLCDVRFSNGSYKIFFSGTKRPMTLKRGMQHWVLEFYIVCSNDDPGLTLIYFTAKSNLVHYLLYGKKVKH